MRYISTRADKAVPPKRFLEILLEGLSPDGGLYVPEAYPQLDLRALRTASYQDIAYAVLSSYVGGDIEPAMLRSIIDETYTADIFGSKAVTPVHVVKHNVFLLKLSEGPTLAFKDVPLQLLGRLMEHVLAKRHETLNILGATSGDTGSAAAYAIRGRKGMQLFMLSPKGRMSPFQERQMYTLMDANIHNLVVRGTFDDCQFVVKAVNADAPFKASYRLGAVNSINWARVAAQVVYYVYAWLEVTKGDADEVSFAVPSGNFGNALSAHVAREMGVPIRDIIVCTNGNDVLDEFFSRGAYRVRSGEEVLKTSSPSMDIASASNFERYLFDLVGRDPAAIRAFWSDLSEGHPIYYGDRQFRGIPGMRSGSASEEDVLEAIRIAWQRYKMLIDPHTAVAMHVGLQRRGPHHIPLIIAETAQPAKFADTMMKAVGFKPAAPGSFADLERLPVRCTEIDPDPEAVKRYIKAHP